MKRLSSLFAFVILCHPLCAGVVDSTSATGLSAVAVLNPAARDIVVKSFQRLDTPTKRLLGIDSWSVP